MPAPLSDWSQAVAQFKFTTERPGLKRSILTEDDGPPLKLHGLTAGGPVGLNPRSHQEAVEGGLLKASAGSREVD